MCKLHHGPWSCGRWTDNDFLLDEFDPACPQKGAAYPKYLTISRPKGMLCGECQEKKNREDLARRLAAVEAAKNMKEEGRKVMMGRWRGER